MQRTPPAQNQDEGRRSRAGRLSIEASRLDLTDERMQSGNPHQGTGWVLAVPHCIPRARQLDTRRVVVAVATLAPPPCTATRHPPFSNSSIVSAMKPIESSGFIALRRTTVAATLYDVMSFSS